MPIRDTAASPIVEPLGRVTDLWLDPKSALRKKAIDSLSISTGFPARLVERAIDNAFGELTRPKIAEFIGVEQIPFASPKDSTVLHIAAGNVFTAWLNGVVITLLLGHKCWVKPSMMEPLFAKLWLQSVQMVDLQMAQRISIVPWSDNLLTQVQAVVAYGSDETLEELNQKIPKSSIFVGYGHKISIALIGPGQLDDRELEKAGAQLAEDSELFDLNGCLSPQVVFMNKSAVNIQNAVSKLPKEPEFKFVENLDIFMAQINKYQGSLSTLGVAGDMSMLDPYRSRLEQLGVTRICELGQMQRPPLTWRNGGISLVHALKPLLN